MRKKIKNKLLLKFKKSFNKVSYKGYKFFEINNFIYIKLLKNMNYFSDDLKQKLLITIYLKRKKMKNSRNFLFQFQILFQRNKFEVLNNSLLLHINKFKQKNNFFQKNFLNFHQYIYFYINQIYIISNSYGKMLESHLEILRRKFKQNLGKLVKIELCVKPYKIILKRPAQVRMGGGKAAKFQKLIYPVYPGLIILKLIGCLYKSVLFYFNQIQNKIPFKLCCINLNRF